VRSSMEAKSPAPPIGSVSSPRGRRRSPGKQAHPREPQAPGRRHEVPGEGKGRLTEEDAAGVRTWSLDYAFTDSWWAGFGLNLDNWARGAPEGFFRDTPTMLVSTRAR